jgi:hypothetical protein
LRRRENIFCPDKKKRKRRKGRREERGKEGKGKKRSDISGGLLC